ncbi:MAG: iron-containing redox enzyme family protein, partial [Thermoanaerobaculia bacterium]
MLESIELPTIPLLPHGAASQPAQETLSALLQRVIDEPELDHLLERRIGLEEELVSEARTLARRAYPADRTTDRQSASWIYHAARDELHRTLVVLYRQHVLLPTDSSLTNQYHPLPCRVLHELETPWEHDMLRRLKANHSLSRESLPEDPAEFAAWYRSAAFGHPLYEHDLYAFVASEATREQLEWFFRMECAGEAAFDDMVALAQVGTRGEVKMEMASNYWDEMGKGKSHAVHTHLFHRLIESLDLISPDASELPWQVLAGVNTMLWACIPRRNAFRAQGALGAVELLAPQRCT